MIPKRERNEAGNCALILVAVFVLLVILGTCSMNANNPCDDPGFNQDGTTAQGNRNMQDCADGWQ
jgi:hypothetical protein